MSKKYTAKIPPGTHLASSKDTYGAKRGTLLDDYTNEIVGQAEFIEEDDYDDDDDYDDYNDDSDTSSLGGIIGAGLALGAIALIARAVSNSSEEDEDESAYNEKQTLEYEKKKIKREIELEKYRQQELRKEEQRKKINSFFLKCFIGCCKGIWWVTKHIAIGLWYVIKYTSIALWFITKHLVIALWWCTKKISIWSYKKIKQTIDKKRQKKIELEDITENYTEITSRIYNNVNISPEQFSEDVDNAFTEFQKNMSNEEAQLHFIKILLLSSELAKEIREFSTSCITNNPKICEDLSIWQDIMEKLMTEKTSRYINYILESNGEKIESSIKKSIMENFGVKLWDSKEFIPIRQEQINDALKTN